MANKIKESDIFDGRIFEQQLKDAIELKSTTEELVKILQKKVSFADPKNSAEVKELNADLEKLTLTRKILVEQNRIENEQRKTAQKEKQKELDNYQKLSKELNENRKALKDLLALQAQGIKLTKEQEKAVKDLTEEVQKQDKALKEIDATAGQFQRNVGNYPKIAEKAKGGFSSLSGFLLGVVVGAFAKSRAESRQFQGVIERLTNAVSILAQAVLKSFTEVIIPTFKEWGLRIQSVVSALKLQFEESDKLSKKADELGAKTKSLSDIWGGLNEVFKESDDLTVRRLELVDRLIDQSVILEASIEKLRGQEEAIAVTIGDATSSFTEQTKAIEEVLKVQGLRVEQELQLAKIQRDIALVTAENELVNKQFFKNLTEAQKQDLRQKLQTLEFVKDKQLADAVSVETLEALKVATVGVIQAENERTKFQKEQAKELRQIQQDLFEQNLDILLDGFDNQKTINERIIADNLRVFEERKKVLERTKQLNEQNLKDQQDLFIQQTGVQIDLNDLVNTDDQKLLQQKLQRLDTLSEIERQRLLEVIRDQRTANQDLLDAERDLEQAIIEKDQRIFESKKRLQELETEFTIGQIERRSEKEEELQEQNLIFRAKKLKEYIKQSEGLQLELLELERQAQIREANKIVEADERAQKLLEIEEDFQNQRFALSQETADKIKEAERKEFLSKVEFAEKIKNEVVRITSETVDRQTEIQKAGLDRQIKEREEAVEKAKNGDAKFLAFQEAEKAKAELKRQQLEEQVRKRENATKKFDAFLQSYLTNLKQPNTTSERAFAKALKDTGAVFALETAIGGLFSAKDGAEDTGEGGNVDKDKGFLAVLHPHERVLTKEQNAPLLSMGVKNDMIPQLVADGLKYNSMPNIMQSVEMQRKFNSTDVLGRKLDELKKTIENKPYYIDKTDKHGNFERSTVENGMIRTIKYVRSKPRL